MGASRSSIGGSRSSIGGSTAKHLAAHGQAKVASRLKRLAPHASSPWQLTVKHWRLTVKHWRLTVEHWRLALLQRLLGPSTPPARSGSDYSGRRSERFAAAQAGIDSQVSTCRPCASAI